MCGASGYVGGELVRWLLRHPRMDLARVTAGARAGLRLDAVFPQMEGHTDLVLGGESPAALCREVDVVFLALPHGEAARAVAEIGPDAPGLPRIVDLGGDHRIPDAETWARAYGRPHPAPHLVPGFVYGLPEANRGLLLGARRVANPGCFATALALALLPLAREGVLDGPVPAFGLTGSSGSGVTPSETTHHPARAGNVRVYNALSHRHVPEVEGILRQVGKDRVGDAFRLDFVPASAPLVRGILVTVFPGGGAGGIDDVVRLYRDTYSSDPFVRVVDRSPGLSAVRGTNRAEVAIHAGEGGSLAVTCALDNLARGAATQAIANLNLSMGWPESLGIDAIALVP